jgi:hypothetical protein
MVKRFSTPFESRSFQRTLTADITLLAMQLNKSIETGATQNRQPVRELFIVKPP